MGAFSSHVVPEKRRDVFPVSATLGAFTNDGALVCLVGVTISAILFFSVRLSHSRSHPARQKAVGANSWIKATCAQVGLSVRKCKPRPTALTMPLHNAQKRTQSNQDFRR